MTSAAPAELYAFEIVLHGRPGAVAGRAGTHRDTLGIWPTLGVSRDTLALPMAAGFDEAFARLAELERMYVEPDGSFVWPSPPDGAWWQVDGNALEMGGRVLLVELKGSCPPADFDRLLQGFGWPGQAMMMQLVRPAVFLDEATFRRHAACRGMAGDGLTLRPR